jgi:hypothetical protein
MVFSSANEEVEALGYLIERDSFRSVAKAAQRNKVSVNKIQLYIQFGRKNREREYPIKFMRDGDRDG